MDSALLKKRLAEAPLAEPADAVKLAYQSAFGCGHLLSDASACLRWLAEEKRATPIHTQTPAATLLGGGLCRLNLAAPMVAALPEERILSMMKLTEQRVTARQGNEAAFRESLRQLRSMAGAGETPFSLPELQAYLAGYEADGCPPVSHSPRYRAAYRPAYRVVLSDFAVLLPLMAELETRLASPAVAEEAGATRGGRATGPEGAAPCGQPGDSLAVVLDGCCGAGKTTLAGLLAALYLAPVIHMDDFFLPPRLRTAERLGQPGGNVHYERFGEQVLARLGAGEAFAYQRFDCATGEMRPAVCPAAPLRVVEGSYALHPRFRAAYEAMHALTAFVWVDGREQLRRLGARDPEKLPRFIREWIPMENAYFAATKAREWAEVRLESISSLPLPSGEGRSPFA